MSQVAVETVAVSDPWNKYQKGAFDSRLKFQLDLALSLIQTDLERLEMDWEEVGNETTKPGYIPQKSFRKSHLGVQGLFLLQAWTHEWSGSPS